MFAADFLSRCVVNSQSIFAFLPSGEVWVGTLQLRGVSLNSKTVWQDVQVRVACNVPEEHLTHLRLLCAALPFSVPASPCPLVCSAFKPWLGTVAVPQLAPRPQASRSLSSRQPVVPAASSWRESSSNALALRTIQAALRAVWRVRRFIRLAGGDAKICECTRRTRTTLRQPRTDDTHTHTHRYRAQTTKRRVA